MDSINQIFQYPIMVGILEYLSGFDKLCLYRAYPNILTYLRISIRCTECKKNYSVDNIILTVAINELGFYNVNLNCNVCYKKLTVFCDRSCYNDKYSCSGCGRFICKDTVGMKKNGVILCHSKDCSIYGE